MIDGALLKAAPGGNPVAIPPLIFKKHRFCRVSSVVEQRFCKPLVGSSNLSPGTAFPPGPRGYLWGTEGR
jgi:hypothetical protein